MTTELERMAQLFGWARQKFNPNHDPDNGQFSEGGGSSSSGEDSTSDSNSNDYPMPKIGASPIAPKVEATIRHAKLPATHMDGLEEVRFTNKQYIGTIGGAALGLYTPGLNRIDISAGVDDERVIGGNTILHEIGHHVHLAKLTNQAATEWGDISKRGTTAKISAYAKTNQAEHFAEAYRAYSSGGRDRENLKNLEPQSYKFMGRLFGANPPVFPRGRLASIGFVGTRIGG